jgi:glycosyltransferase involved in cell wall biosynthesis
MKPKIAILANDWSQSFPTIDCGGAEYCVEVLAKGLYKNGYDFFVICPNREVKSKYGFEVIDTNAKPNKLSGVRDAYQKEAVDILLTKEFDLLLSPFCYKGFEAIKKPIFCTIHGCGDGNINPLPDHSNIYFQFISDTQYEKCLISRPEYKSRSFLAYTSLLDEDFYLGDNEGYFLWVASLQWPPEAKGLDVFIRMVGQLSNFRYKAYGAGNPELENALRGLHVSYPNFEYCGFLDRNTEEHNKVFAGAKAFCQFSRLQESFGRTTIEALSKGVPVIGFPMGATSAFVKDGVNGFIVKTFDELVEAVWKTSSISRKNIMEDARTKFSVNSEIEKIISYFNSVESSRGPKK